MSDREDQSNLPPIPDGGLTEAMPDWLRRPPAWRDLPDREVTAPEPPENASDLPAADESAIDPRTFLTDDDLPAWLKNLGRGMTARQQVESEELLPANDGIQPVSGEEPTDAQPEQPASRFVPSAPPPARVETIGNASDSGNIPRQEASAGPATSLAWQRAGIVAGLALLLIVGIVVVILL